MLRKFFIFSLAFILLFTITANAQTIHDLFHHAGDPVGGNPNGKVTVVEFFDYQCSHCMNMAPIIAAIIKANPDVRIVFKDYPIRGPLSEFAARTALAAKKQGKYFEMNHALLTTDQPLTENVVFDIAKGMGLDIKKLKKEMNSNAINAQLNTHLKLAQALNISGTPAFIIGTTNAKNKDNVDYILGEMTQTEMQNAIDKARK